jgi:Fic family protein
MAMSRGQTGRYYPISTIDESVKAFVPNPLPPNPPLKIDPTIQEANDFAFHSLGRLDSASSFLPATPLFLYQYIRKEAVLSSQIEGTQSSLSDLLLFELDTLPGVPLEDVAEVAHYVAALEHGLRRLKEGFPLSLRLIKEIHAILLRGGRGSDKTPGEFRRSQNWIGGSRPGNAVYVPPPPDLVIECMGALELFLHDRHGKFNPLVKAALFHAQFETIHPFLDGNGRLGRLLITLILVHEKILSEPNLYLSLYLKKHRPKYYEHLQNVRIHGDWENWLLFFLKAVRTTADQGVETANRLNRMAQSDREKIKGLGRLSGSILHVHHELLSRPIASVLFLAGKTGLVPNTVAKVLNALKELGLIKEITGKSRNRIFVYTQCLDIMNEGTEYDAKKER